MTSKQNALPKAVYHMGRIEGEPHHFTHFGSLASAIDRFFDSSFWHGANRDRNRDRDLEVDCLNSVVRDVAGRARLTPLEQNCLHDRFRDHKSDPYPAVIVRPTAVTEAGIRYDRACVAKDVFTEEDDLSAFAMMLQKSGVPVVDRENGETRDALAARLAQAFREQGFDLIVYENRLEDQGSTSFCALDPASVQRTREVPMLVVGIDPQQVHHAIDVFEGTLVHEHGRAPADAKMVADRLRQEDWKKCAQAWADKKGMGFPLAFTYGGGEGFDIRNASRVGFRERMTEEMQARLERGIGAGKIPFDRWTGTDRDNGRIKMSSVHSGNLAGLEPDTPEAPNAWERFVARMMRLRPNLSLRKQPDAPSSDAPPGPRLR